MELIDTPGKLRNLVGKSILGNRLISGPPGLAIQGAMPWGKLRQ